MKKLGLVLLSLFAVLTADITSITHFEPSPYNLAPTTRLLTDPASLENDSNIDAELLRNAEKSEAVLKKVKSLQIAFTPNHGQVDDRVKFYANTFAGSVSVTKTGEIVYSMRGDGRQSEASSQSQANTVTLKEQLIAAKVEEVKGESESVTKVSYFRGNDPSKWLSNISTYDLVNLGEVYNGIDLKLKAYGNNVEKLFYVKPDADPNSINIKLEGAKNLSVNNNGELVAQTEQGEVKFTKPVAYQEIDGERVNVEVAYDFPSALPDFRASDLVYSFAVGDYDKSKELVIDPLLASTFLGSTGADEVYSIALDNEDNVYVGGRTSHSNIILLSPSSTDNIPCNAPDGYCSGIFVAKLNNDLTTLISYTYLSGTYLDRLYAMTIGPAGDIYIAGETSSKDFPVTSGAYSTKCNSAPAFLGCKEAFAAKLDSKLTTLLAATYLGGSSYDSAKSIAVDSNNNVYVAGSTSSKDFPVTVGAYITSYRGGDYYSGDAFISKFNKDLTTLLASTYMGGSSTDIASAIALDTDGNVYVTGETKSNDFPLTIGTAGTILNSIDAFVAKLTGDLSSLIASRYLGGSSDDSAHSLAIDPSGNIFIAGSTKSSDFPVTASAYSTTFSGESYKTDAFISKISGDLTTIIASTFTGGAESDEANSIIIGKDGNVYVAGTTFSFDFPATAGSYDSSMNNAISKVLYPTSDVFIAQFKGDLTILARSTFLGGSSPDSTTSIALDSSGNIYVAGRTSSIDFPVTTTAYDTVHNNNPICINSAHPSTQDDIKITFTWGTSSCGVSYSSSHTISGNNISINIYEKEEPSVGNTCPAVINPKTITEDIGKLPAGEYKVTVFINDQLVTSRPFEVKDIPPSTPVICSTHASYFGNDAFVSKFDPDIASETVLIPGISVSPATLNFGVISVGNIATKKIVISNTGNSNLSVSSFSITGSESSEFSPVNNCSAITPGSSCTISITFSPSNAGPRNADININFSDPNIPLINVTLTGEGHGYSLTIIKEGDGNGSITGEGLSCNTDPCGELCSGTCKGFYKEGTLVTLSAKADTGSIFQRWFGVCKIKECKGKGCNAIEYKGPNCKAPMDHSLVIWAKFIKADDPVISVSSTYVNFGKVKLNTSKTKFLTIRNRGKGALTIAGISMDFEQNSEFKTNFKDEITIGPKGSYTLAVKFTPKSKGEKMGEKIVLMTISSNDPNAPKKGIELLGFVK